ncbi:A/G-specific adenine glycosylase [Prosthecobacter sp.]|uniref:A/G-specific adenine glycosylase n=1 Tax=Prosthecobacter sp. TaxID=1965333 RepID=UPI002ABA9956|nr:A/G-specific adenine glycosylase [Prosthecobacter sp.]MDZ4404161.1 A/G-specific adenine glycosylase [Prosthecobacter sp.]
MSSPAVTPDPTAVATALVAWFREQARDYPWRRTRDPYAILISEVMLQQTQISTVLDRGYYARWLERFPDFSTLAEAREDEVLKVWEGLGYYRRARNLQRLAKEVIENHGGVFPRDPATILALPGIGPYTAGAVASFAFGLAEPIVDGNIARVLSRVYNDATPVDSTAGTKLLWERAKSFVKTTDDPRALNSALMELGQTHCAPTKPTCDLCPVHRHCRATSPELLPVKNARPEITAVTERVVFLRTSAGVLLELETGKRRTGLWKLPALHPMHADKPPPLLLRTHYGITRYKVTLWVHEPQAQEMRWPDTHRIISFAELESTPMPAPYRRALRELLQRGEFRLDA